ncbi:MAG: hypothetical protein ACM3PF_05505 [Bacteroidota bacterium]
MKRGSRDSTGSVARYGPLLFPALVAALLSLPCLGFGFLWDDFIFLTNALTGNLRDWLPRTDDPFYRPISRALYFALVAPFGTGGALFAHLMNLAYLVVAVVCLTLLASRLRSRRFGLLAGMLFAGMMAVPTLVGWASCSQDLLAIDFVLLALLARSSGRGGLALTAFVAALLSKETALATAPALVLWDWVCPKRQAGLGRGASLMRPAALYGAVIVVWAAIHPAVRVLLAKGLAPGATGYVGLTSPGTWLLFAARYVTVLTNLRLGRFDPTWPGAITIYLAVVVIGATWGLSRILATAPLKDSPAEVPAARGTSRRGVAMLGIALAVPPFVMTSTIINSWAPYYAAFPMVGLSLAGALALERIRFEVAVAIVGAYLALGTWARGSDLDSWHMNERALRPSSDAMDKVEAGFLKLAPTLPKGTEILLSIQMHGRSRIYAQMYFCQPPRLWYRDPTIHVVKPLWARMSERPTVLTVITSDNDVIFVNPGRLDALSASGAPPQYAACEKALRAAAIGLAGSGATDQGLHLMLRIPNPTEGFANEHRRMAAMLLYAAGRDRSADSLVAASAPISRPDALASVHILLAEQPPRAVLDDAALRAYGIRGDDPIALRDIAGWLAQFGYAEPARRFASRLLALEPRDPTGLRAQAVADSILVERRKWPEELL